MPGTSSNSSRATGEYQNHRHRAPIPVQVHGGDLQSSKHGAGFSERRQTEVTILVACWRPQGEQRVPDKREAARKAMLRGPVVFIGTASGISWPNDLEPSSSLLHTQRSASRGDVNRCLSSNDWYSIAAPRGQRLCCGGVAGVSTSRGGVARRMRRVERCERKIVRVGCLKLHETSCGTHSEKSSTIAANTLAGISISEASVRQKKRLSILEASSETKEETEQQRARSAA
jgi:hypothetical protein